MSVDVGKSLKLIKNNLLLTNLEKCIIICRFGSVINNNELFITNNCFLVPIKNNLCLIN